MLKLLIIKFLAFLNLGEGIIHVVVSLISFWGMYDTGIWDLRIAAAPSTDLFLGLTSLLTAVLLKDMVGKYHH